MSTEATTPAADAAPAPAPSAARLDDVWVRYPRGDRVVEALRGVTLDVPAGDFLAVQGPSGSGKSTLLRLLAGLQTPTSGEVHLGGTPLASLDDASRALLRRRRIGYLHQLANLLPDLTAEENVALPLRLDGLRDAEARPRAEAALARLRVDHLLDRRPDELSGGEMLRVALARALVIEPLLVLADEPTGNLDRQNGSRVLDLFHELHAGGNVTFVIVTHDDEVAAAAHRTLHLVDGRIADRSSNR